jgi:L-ribulose-5-phosphate 4-epimerase
MLESLKQSVLEANLGLVTHRLVTFTWGNVSGQDPQTGLVVIKPSGVAYEQLTVEHLVTVDLEGNVVEGQLKPSSDTPTHLELYQKFPQVGGIVHTHSTYATAWAQAGISIPILGTTHADYFQTDVPCSRYMTNEEIESHYEHNTGKVITELFDKIDYNFTPAALVINHGPFVWGRDPQEALHNAVVLEEIAKIALLTFNINPQSRIAPVLVKKHFERKHGRNAYYGQ